MTATVSAHTMLDAYVDALTTGQTFEQFFTDDVTIEMMGTSLAAHGRDDVAAFIRWGHQVAFASTIEFGATLVDPDGRQAAMELVFRGTHMAEFAGIPATGRDVQVRYSVHYDLTDDGISALRVYGLAQGLVDALTAAAPA